MGGGSHGHGGGGLHLPEGCRIPDWRIYKWENHAELANVQRKLAAKGLKDPWMRNEAWRYAPIWGTKTSRWIAFLGRGIPQGFAAFLLTIAVESLFLKKDDHHGHGHGHDDHH